MTARRSDYIVFVDESGDHSLEKINADYPIFVLCFCVLPIDAYIDQVTPQIRRLKAATFGHDLVILHERDLRKRTGHFSGLSEDARERLLEGLTQIISDAPMTLIAVVIKKEAHIQKYHFPEHPYHLAMQFGLERVYHFLAMRGQRDRMTSVVCECRGKKEDADLELNFRRVCDGDNRATAHLPFDIVFADKKANCEGLQLADLTARPMGQSVLRPGQPNRSREVLQSKLFTGSAGSINGNGLKVFP